MASQRHTDEMHLAKPATLAIAGPTAAGKTAAALAVAARHDCEIVSVDSALVYRGMDIGTAKPSAAELAAVPHHLIDIRDPRDAYSAAEFVADARRLINEIHARGRTALLVGGTMLYFKALADGIDAMPAANPALRAAIEAEAAHKGWPALHSELALMDPATAARLAPADSQRIQRALEVYRSSGKPLSSFFTEKEGRRFQFPLISLEPADRTWLHARIAERFDTMLNAGLIEEVRGLRARGDLNADLPSMRCVGYRQTWEALDELDATHDLDARKSGNAREPHTSLDSRATAALRDKGIFATRQLAKRQITWLRSMPGRHIVAADSPDALHQTLALADRLIAQSRTQTQTHTEPRTGAAST